jgi:ribosomal protein L37AE/L43A
MNPRGKSAALHMPETAMARNFPKTGKRVRPKTAVKGKRYLCADCHKRSPRRVTTPAPWYCPNCLKTKAAPAT